MKSMLSRILALSVVCLGTTYAGQATFHLPFDAQWGKTSLPAGDYRITLPESGKNTKVFYLSGPGVSIFKLAGAWSGGQPLGASYFTVVEMNGQHYIQDYFSGGTGNSYQFVVPKQSHHMKFAAQKLPVTPEGTK